MDRPGAFSECGLVVLRVRVRKVCRAYVGGKMRAASVFESQVAPLVSTYAMIVFCSSSMTFCWSRSVHGKFVGDGAVTAAEHGAGL